MGGDDVSTTGRRARLAMAAGILGLAVVAGSLVATGGPAEAATARQLATPAPTATKPPTGRALAAGIIGSPVLTLPAKDGLRDSTLVRIRSGAGGHFDLIATAGKKSVHLADRVTLSAVRTGWQRTVRIAVQQLPAGSWTIRARRSDDHGLHAKAPAALLVGSGKPVHVYVRPAARTLYPWKDGTLDTAVVAVTATDETGAALPITGSVRVDEAKRHVTRTLDRNDTARVPITSLPIGTATMTATVTGPAGRAVRRSALRLAATGVGTLRIARSSDTVQPVVDGLLDSVVLTTTGAASAGSTAKVSGTLTISRGTTTAARFAVHDGRPHGFTWNGRVKGVLVAGTYTVTLSLKGPQGAARTRTTTLLVSRKHLAYRVRDEFTLAAGNEQGLAVHNGNFYVGYDLGSGQARIDVYDGAGRHLSSLGPLPIGHVAELSYSTTTKLLYAANGGNTTPTTVWAIDPLDPQWTADPQTDPSAAIRKTFDLHEIGNNGMVAVDDANARLLVFAGSSGSYTITPVSLTDVTTTDAAGTTTTVPAGTPGTSVPISITGVPQGMELVGQQLWVYTSLKHENHIAKYDLAGNPVLASAAVSGSSDLIYPGEGEGLAIDLTTGWIYVGAHSSNRIGELVPVVDE